MPTRFAVCYGVFGVQGRSSDPSRISSLLPAPARGLLRAHRLKHARMAPNFACSDLLTEEARTVADALRGAGLERSRFGAAWNLAYDVKALGSGKAFVFFEPYLPHGEWICSGCG